MNLVKKYVRPSLKYDRDRDIYLPHVSIPLDGSSLRCALLRSTNIPPAALPQARCAALYFG